jgi:DNA-binding transcriptional regulator YbjK
MARMSSVDRRSELLQAALRVISTQGVTGTTTRAIVAEAGMSLASFHYAFESRDEMMRELIELVVENEASAVSASFEFGSDIRSSIRNGLTAFFDTIQSDPSHEQVMFELQQYALRTAGLEHLAREQHDRYREAVARILVEGADSAGIRWAIPVDDVARLVVTITDGITLGWLADRDAAAATRVIEFSTDSLARLALPVVPTATPTTAPTTSSSTTPRTTASTKEYSA